jgi:hypothetical protein
LALGLRPGYGVIGLTSPEDGHNVDDALTAVAEELLELPQELGEGMGLLPVAGADGNGLGRIRSVSETLCVPEGFRFFGRGVVVCRHLGVRTLG